MQLPWCLKKTEEEDANTIFPKHSASIAEDQVVQTAAITIEGKYGISRKLHNFEATKVSGLATKILITKPQQAYRSTRISGPYGPQILALAEGWLASLTRGLATLNLIWGLRPLNFIFICLGLSWIFLVLVQQNLRLKNVLINFLAINPLLLRGSPPRQPLPPNSYCPWAGCWVVYTNKHAHANWDHHSSYG